MNWLSGIGNFLGNAVHGVSSFVQHPFQPSPPQPQQNPYNLGSFLNQHLGQTANTVGNDVNQIKVRLGQGAQTAGHAIAQVPNIHLQGVEQLTGKPTTIGSVAQATPVLGNAIRFAQNADPAHPNIGNFVKGIAGAGIQGAGYVAPEAKILKAGEAAPLVAKLGAKFVNQAVPAAGLSVAGDVVKGNRNPGQIAKDAAFNAVGAGALNAAPTAARQVVPAVQKGAQLATDAYKASPVLSDQAGFVKVPGAKTRGFVKSVQTSPEVSPTVQKAVTGTYVPGTNAQKLATSNALISGDLGQATDKVLGSLSQTSGRITPQQISDAIAVAKAHDAAGNFGQASDIYSKLATHGTSAGQKVQALSLLANRTPQGIHYSAMKALDNAGVKMTPQLSGKLQDGLSAIKATAEGTQERYNAVQDLQKVVNNHVPSNAADKALGLWRTGLLTGPQTVSKVLVSHGVQNIMEKAKDIPGSLIDRAISLGTKQRGLVLTGKGTFSGAKPGIKAAGTLLKTGHDTMGTGGFTDTAAGMLAHPTTTYGNGRIGKFVQKVTGKGPGEFGTGGALNAYTQKVGQVHAAMPKAFFTSAQKNDLYKQAIAQAKTQGLRGSDAKAFVDELVKNPNDAMKNEANLAAQRATFQQQTALGKQASALQKVPGGKFVAPFAHIASSILSDAVDYSPIGAAKAVYQAVKEKGASGWTPTVQKHFSEELGRSITGTSAIVMGAALYKSGVMTLGFPSDPKKQAEWKAAGKQENSILLNGKWRKLDALGPIGTVLSMGGYGASSNDVGGKGNAAAGALAGGIKNIGGQSYLSGLTGAANAISDPQRSAMTYVKSVASSLVPTGVGTVARAIDPMQRQTNNIGQAIQSKIPFLRQSLLPAQDAFGHTLPREGGVATNLLDPTRPTTAVTSSMMQELNRLDSAGHTTSPTVVKSIGTQKLTPQQVFDRTAVVGPQIAQAYQKVMSSPAYSALSDANKAKALANAASDINSVGNVRTLQSINPQAAQKAYTGLTSNQKAILSGQPPVTNYTALDANGKSVGTTAVSPRESYTQALAKYQQQKSAGLLTPVQDYKTQLALSKQNITSNYSTDVQQLYGLSNAQRTAAIKANPALGNLMPQVNQLATALKTGGATKTARIGTGTSTKTSAKKYAAQVAKLNQPPKVKAVKLAKLPKLKTPSTKARYAKLPAIRTSKVRQLIA